MPNNARQSGNVFFALFGAVALVGVVGASVTTILKGPVAGMQRVTKYTVAENNMIAAGKLALIAATNQPLSGDCDADDMVEPIPFSTTGDGPFPTGGGYLPAEIGATRQDPWGNIYGYCVWDHGIDPEDPADNDGECGGNTNFRAGADSEQYIALAVISSGPDRIFQSSCNDFDPENPELPLVVKSAGSDDVVLAYTYAEAGSMSGGLWKLKSGDSSTAEVGNRNVEISGSGGAGDAARIGYDEGLDMSGVGDFLAVKTDYIYARTADGDVSMESPLRVKVVDELEKPMGVAGEGIGTKSVVAPRLRQLIPTMPIAPDGQDWADAIVCQHAANAGIVFNLIHYSTPGSGNNQIFYRYNQAPESTDVYTYYNHTTGAQGNTASYGSSCPANYASAVKIYYGGGGGGNVPSILPGWPDAIKCPRSVDTGNNIFYLVNTSHDSSNSVIYSLAGSSNTNWTLFFNKTTRVLNSSEPAAVAANLSSAARHCTNASTTIDMLIEDGRGIFFGGGSDASAGGPAIPSFSCPGGFEKVGALGCIQSAENSPAFWTSASNGCFNAHGGRLPTSAEWYAAAANSTTMTGKTGNWEWVADLVGESSPYDNHGVVGSTAITDFSWASDTTPGNSYAYRCFIPASGGGGGGGGGGDFQIASGGFAFMSDNPPLCGSSTSNLCTVDISSGGFSSAPVCNITLRNSDGTAYTENVVIQSTSPTELKFWRGQYLGNGTSFIGDWICAVGSGSGGGADESVSQSVFAPALRQQVPSMPLAPDGKDWADAIVCPSTHGAAYIFRLILYYPNGSGNDQVYYRYMTPGTQDYGVYYNHTTGARGSADGAGVLPATACAANYNSAIKVYYGGGGSGGDNFLPGWPDVISCEFSGAPYDGEEVFFYPAGINNAGMYAYFTQVSTGGERFLLVYGADKSFVSFVELPGNATRTGSCDGKSISELYTEGRAFDFGGGGGSSGAATALPTISGARQLVTSGALQSHYTDYVQLPRGVYLGNFYNCLSASSQEYYVNMIAEANSGTVTSNYTNRHSSTMGAFTQIPFVFRVTSDTANVRFRVWNPAGGTLTDTANVAEKCSSFMYEQINSGSSAGGATGDSVWSTSGSNAYRSAGRVGIGTSTPRSQLDVAEFVTMSGGPNSYYGFGSIPQNQLPAGDIDLTRDMSSSSGGSANSIIRLNGHTGLSFSAHSNYGGIRFYNQGYSNSDPYATYKPSDGALLAMTVVGGSVGIGTSNPANRLHVNGNIGATGWVGAGCEGACEAGGGYALMYANGDIVITGSSYKPGGGVWTATSDARLKNLDGAYEQGLDSIVRLKPVRFHYKEGNPRNEPTGKEFVGLVAQDVQPIFPEAISEDESGYLTLDSTPISYAVINAIRELKALFDDLAAKLADLIADVTRLSEADEALSRQIAELRADNDNLRADNDNLRARLERLEAAE